MDSGILRFASCYRLFEWNDVRDPESVIRKSIEGDIR
jgi:hypothetical protein